MAQQAPATPNSRSFFQFMQKAQEDIQEEFKIRLYVSLYFRALRSDQVLNYDEKAWLMERVEDLYTIDIFEPLKINIVCKSFCKNQQKSSKILWKWIKYWLLLLRRARKVYVMSWFALPYLLATGI